MIGLAALPYVLQQPHCEAAGVEPLQRTCACPQRSEDSRRCASRRDIPPSKTGNTGLNLFAESLPAAINFDSDGGAAITAPLPVGNTGRTSNQGAV